MTSYELLLKYKFIFSTYSTLANESLAKGARVGFIMYKSSKNPIFSYRFGSFSKLKTKGLFSDNHKLEGALGLSNDQIHGLDIKVSFTIEETTEIELADLDQ